MQWSIRKNTRVNKIECLFKIAALQFKNNGKDAAQDTADNKRLHTVCSLKAIRLFVLQAYVPTSQQVCQ